MKKKSTFFKDFKKFISKGNVLDLAVATIIGASFSTIVKSFTDGIIMPLVSLLFKAENLDKLVITLRPAELAEDGTELAKAITWQYGTLIQAVINFVIVAFFLFVLVRVISKARKTLDINANMKATIQVKLDKDEPLTEIEEKWMKTMAKRNPEEVPKKTPPAPAPVPPEPTTTEKLLAEILETLKNK